MPKFDPTPSARSSAARPVSASPRRQRVLVFEDVDLFAVENHTPEDDVLDDAALAAQDRLDHDHARYLAMTKAGFKGPEYRAFCDDLWAYSMRVLGSALRTGVIFQWCWEGFIAIKPTDDERRVLRASVADRDALVVETIARGIRYFRKNVLLKRRWSAKRGASLRTFFINTCKHQFRGVFRRWQRERVDRLTAYGYGVDPVLVASELSNNLAEDPEQHVMASELISRIMKRATPEAKMACYLLLQDLTHAEIGERLSMTERAVEGHLHRLRKHARTMVKNGRIEVPSFLEAKRIGRAA